VLVAILAAAGDAVPDAEYSFLYYFFNFTDFVLLQNGEPNAVVAFVNGLTGADPRIVPL